MLFKELVGAQEDNGLQAAAQNLRRRLAALCGEEADIQRTDPARGRVQHAETGPAIGNCASFLR